MLTSDQTRYVDRMVISPVEAPAVSLTQNSPKPAAVATERDADEDGDPPVARPAEELVQSDGGKHGEAEHEDQDRPGHPHRMQTGQRVHRLDQRGEVVRRATTTVMAMRAATSRRRYRKMIAVRTSTKAMAPKYL